MNNSCLRDQEARDKILKDIDYLNKTLMVEAGAGSGKTTSLVGRMINQIKYGVCEVEQMVAITFTKKAATELKERFEKTLEKAFNNSNGIERERFSEALQKLPQCYIGTIHSFCAKLLRERPIEARVNPHFRELDEQEEERLLSQIWYEYIDLKYHSSKEELDYFKNQEIPLTALYNTYRRIIQFSDVEIILGEELSDENRMGLVDKAYNEIKVITSEMVEQIKIEPKKKPLLIHNKIREYMNELEKERETEEEKIECIGKVEDIYKGKKSEKWENIGRVDELWDGAKNICKDIREVISENTAHPIYCKGIKFAEEARAYYDIRKAESSFLGFQDLLMKTKEMLKVNESLRRELGKKYTLFLVDEFQDTDPIQADIMRYLTEDEEQPDRIRQGSLFIVGDPKQAIYRFRRADIQIYEQFKEEIKKSNGEVLELTTNFRSKESICKWVNKGFSSILSKEKNACQVAFTPMHFNQKGSEKCIEGVKKIVIEGENAVKCAAEEVANLIQWMIQSKKYIAYEQDGVIRERRVTLKDFMVLTYSKNDVEHYKQALELKGIQVCATGGFKLVDNPHVNSFINLIKYLNEPQNSILLMATLKDSFGMSDQMIYEWHKKNQDKNIHRGLNLYYKDEAILQGGDTISNDIKMIYDKVELYKKWKKTYSNICFIQKVLEDRGSIIATPSNKNYDYASLYCLIEKLKAIQGEGELTLDELIERMEDIAKTEITEIMSIESEEVDVVRVMNVHKAKGLEAPIVILTSPKKCPNHSIDSYIERRDGMARGYFSIFDRIDKVISLKCKPLKWDEMKMLDKQHQEAEQKRLQYVAATRAKDLLIVVSHPQKDSVCQWKDLYEFITEEIKVDTLHDNKIVDCDDRKHLDKAIEMIEDWQSKLGKETYKWTHPTEDKKIIGKVEVEKGGGEKWGTLIHSVFEHIVKQTPSLDETIRLLYKGDSMYKLLDASEKEAFPEKIQLTVEKFKKSSLINRLQQAEQIYTEVPFALEIENEDDKKIYLRGIIDLVFKENDGWVIIDYKSDHIKSKEDAMERGKSYQSQILTYKEVWEKITHQKVTSAELYFAHIGHLIEVKG